MSNFFPIINKPINNERMVSPAAAGDTIHWPDVWVALLVAIVGVLKLIEFLQKDLYNKFSLLNYIYDIHINHIYMSNNRIFVNVTMYCYMYLLRIFWCYMYSCMYVT